MTKWTKIEDGRAETLPPNPDQHFSERVWLALPDGTVVRGQWLARRREDGAGVHSWFDDGNPSRMLSVRPIAWAPCEAPAHPDSTSGSPEADDASRLKDVQVTFFFQVANQVDNGLEEPEEQVELRWRILQEAYEIARSRYSQLPSSQGPCPGEDFTVPQYEICENDVMDEVRAGRIVSGIAFYRSAPFADQALSELRRLCTQAFEEAAGKRGVQVAYAGCREWRRLELTQTRELEVAVI